MRKILIVIDMQNDFIDGALGTAEAVGGGKISSCSPLHQGYGRLGNPSGDRRPAQRRKNL